MVDGLTVGFGLPDHVHHLAQHEVLLRFGPGVPVLPALRAAHLGRLLVLLPVAVDAAAAVVVAAHQAKRELQQVQADGARELVLVQRNL